MSYSGAAGRFARDAALMRTTSASPRVNFGSSNSPGASLDLQLPAVYISDEKGCLVAKGGGKNPRRSVDMPGSISKPPSLLSPTGRSSEEGSGRGGQAGVRGGDVELAGVSRSLGRDEARLRNSQSMGDKRSPRRPSHGSGDTLGRTKSIDLSGAQTATLLPNPLFAEGGSHSKVRKSVPRLGE